jgi:hypothetical protein
MPLDDLAQEGRGDSSAAVEWNGGLATIGVPELFVRSPLPDLLEAQRVEDSDHLPRFEDGKARHGVRLRPFAFR